MSPEDLKKTGVADYFATIGTGDLLVWKHCQRQGMFGETELERSDVEEDEDESLLQERFYREIVDVKIVMEEDLSKKNAPNSSATPLQPPLAFSHEHSRQPSDASSVLVAAAAAAAAPFGTNVYPPHLASDSFSDGPTIPRPPATAAVATHQPSMVLPHSPSPSDATTTVDNVTIHTATTTPAVQNSSIAQEQSVNAEGWTVVHHTLPASRAGHNDDSGAKHLLWSVRDSLRANLDLVDGLRSNLWNGQQQAPQQHGTQQQWRRKLDSTLQQLRKVQLQTRRTSRNPMVLMKPLPHHHNSSFYIAFRRRRSHQDDLTPAVADLQLGYVRLHRSTVAFDNELPISSAGLHPVPSQATTITSTGTTSNKTTSNSSTTSVGDGAVGRTSPSHLASSQLLGTAAVAPYHSSVPSSVDAFAATKTTVATPMERSNDDGPDDSHHKSVAITEYLRLPDGMDEWCIPEAYAQILDPLASPPTLRAIMGTSDGGSDGQQNHTTVLFAHEDYDDELTTDDHDGTILSGHSGAGVEAIERTFSDNSATTDPELLLPKLYLDMPPSVEEVDHDASFVFVPVLALRRQRVTDEERFHEDAAIVNLAVSFEDGHGRAILPLDDNDEEDEDDNENTFRLLGKTAWYRSHDDAGPAVVSLPPHKVKQRMGMPVVLVQRNQAFGFCDAAFATRVLGRFPVENYHGMPLPEEELPMFCYPTGCRLHRTRFCDAPLPQYYGFVVKNERGDSIYVSCVSFMEPLTATKLRQLAHMSERRRYSSLCHRTFCEQHDKKMRRHCRVVHGEKKDDSDHLVEDDELSMQAEGNFIMMGFDDMMTFENKTICLVGRYPFWTAFRKFLSHLHIMSGSSADLPLERYISHLLLSVPIPRPGACNVLIPLPAFSEPMVLWIPPEKDFPLLDLPYQRLFACLDIKTVVMTVLGMLALERKLIVMSSRPSLVLDVCELMRSLLFPFDLCAPYVPRLTEPFKSSLNFPGAIFVGIHDDGSPRGLAAMVRRESPEDAIILDLDSGAITCDGARHDVIRTSWDVLPDTARSALVSELQTLCRDASITDGQEPLDSLYDSAFAVDLPSAVDGEEIGCETKEPLDDRGVRDAFLRFFCAVLGGYERFLVVPDANFLVSGNEWFDASGYLASVPSERAGYLSALITTQLFQSFVQKRTEASDVHCMLFDECVTEFHSSSVPYGRLGGDVEEVVSGDSDRPHMLYSLLVDQSAALAQLDQSTIGTNKSMDASEADSSFNVSKVSAIFTDLAVRHGEAVFNMSGDLVTVPSRDHLPYGRKYVYCVDGNPCFPVHFRKDLFLPKVPESYQIEMSKKPNPLLARGERELDDAERRRRLATSQERAMQTQRRCMWQLPKLLGSHFLGAWLLCIPSLVSQPKISNDQQSRFLQRALGAIRILRSRQRIVPDESAYRALMVAISRCRSDRRVELVKLFGLLRSDGIFPSAVTLGQYTRALADGYSKRSTGVHDEDYGGVEVTESASRVGRLSVVSMGHRGSGEMKSPLCSMDTNLHMLESQGRRWRQRNAGEDDHDPKRKKTKTWLPVCLSSSFVPDGPEQFQSDDRHIVHLTAIWSRTHACKSCGYIPFDEEIQAGWDVADGYEIPGAVPCPRCNLLMVPLLGVKTLTLDEALDQKHAGLAAAGRLDAPMLDLPPQIRGVAPDRNDPNVTYLTYLSPHSLRHTIEQYVEELGEEILCRDRLLQLDPEVFYNLWFYSARFGLPLPLPINKVSTDGDGVTNGPPEDWCAFVSWEQAVAQRGCYSAARMLAPLLDLDNSLESTVSLEAAAEAAYDEMPLLARFNLQGYHSNVWDHPDLAKILVALVEACDKRDFKAVVESVLHSNAQKQAEAAGSGGIASGDTFDVYRVILYLAKYQCTSAFHTFFPAATKPCKGYHFWCAMGTPLTIFDRLMRDAVSRIQNGKDKTLTVAQSTAQNGPPNSNNGVSIATLVHEVSDVALGFRCVFGHLI